jgi:hypothetical protein
MLKKNRILWGVVVAGAMFMGTTAQASLVHDWAFDGDLNDSSGSGNTGVLSNGDEDYSTVAGKIGQAIYLSGGQYVSNTNPANIPVSGAGAWSLTTWVQYSNANLGYGAVVAGWSPTPGAPGQMRMLINESNNSHLSFLGHTADNFSGGSWPSANAWHQITITHAANATKQVTMYVDGVGSTMAIGPGDLANITSTPTVVVGGNTGWYPNQKFTGAIDDMGIWNQALSDGEVKSLGNVLTVNGGALGDYGIAKMNTLFGVYDTGASATVGGLTWNKFTGAIGGTAGAVTFSDGVYTAWLDSTSGVTTVPEPGTLALLAGGLLGLIAYAWRKRK